MVDEDCKTQHSTIPFQQTGYFSKTICDYLDQDKKLRPYYNNFPDFSGFEKQIKEKKEAFRHTEATRKVLVKTLHTQYQGLNSSKKTLQQIDALLHENTFTVTTGHQLNLFTGPLYFLYKIVSTINLAKRLSAEFTNENFVPIYWMATEDHDFEEINYFNFRGKKIQWNRECKGAVGRLSTEGLQEVASTFSKELGESTTAKELKALFEEAYLKHQNLTDATRYLANALFGDYGLVILDADDKNLKKCFLPYMEAELKDGVSHKEVSNTVAKFGKNYPVQVNPREINLFYLTNELRERIIKENDIYRVNDTNIRWSEHELLEELADFPERFSPNVIMRSLYQEVILPNLCYIGGGAEIAYWLELKSYFSSVKVPLPTLMLRNSVLLISVKQIKKMEKLNLSIADIFYDKHDLVSKKIREVSDLTIDFTPQRKALQDQFKTLHSLAEQTDTSFVGAVKAQEVKQLKGLDKLEKRLLKAEKRKHKELTDRISQLQDALFPNQSLEERQRNFSEFYLEYGEQLIPALLENLDPLKGEFSIITL